MVCFGGAGGEFWWAQLVWPGRSSGVFGERIGICTYLGHGRFSPRQLVRAGRLCFGG